MNKIVSNRPSSHPLTRYVASDVLVLYIIVVVASQVVADLLQVRFRSKTKPQQTQHYAKVANMTGRVHRPGFASLSRVSALICSCAAVAAHMRTTVMVPLHKQQTDNRPQLPSETCPKGRCLAVPDQNMHMPTDPEALSVTSS
jgi:hypothetical protein